MTRLLGFIFTVVQSNHTEPHEATIFATHDLVPSAGRRLYYAKLRCLCAGTALGLIKTRLPSLPFAALLNRPRSALAAGPAGITENPHGSITLTRKGNAAVTRDIIRSRQSERSPGRERKASVLHRAPSRQEVCLIFSTTWPSCLQSELRLLFLTLPPSAETAGT